MTPDRIAELRAARTILLDPEGRVKSVNITREEFDELLDAWWAWELYRIDQTPTIPGNRWAYDTYHGPHISYLPDNPDTPQAAVLAALGKKGEGDGRTG